MNMIKKTTVGSFAAALLALSALPQAANAANLIFNGSFEADSQASGSWAIYSNLSGWAGGSYGIELRNNVAGAAFDGSNYIELDTTHNSASTQVINTSLGAQYILSFAYSPREGVLASSNGIEVLWNGLSQGIFTGAGAPSGNVWGLTSLTVTGASPFSSVEFRAVGTDDSYGGSLDYVSLTAVNETVTTAVPEPETYAMLLAGLGLLGFAARRRKLKEAAVA
jgi:hypothetical protein